MRWATLALLLPLCGCAFSSDGIFNQWAPNFFEESPGAVGPFATTERVLVIENGADGQPLELTIFSPLGVEEARPIMVWVLGSNQAAYYHQSLHETLASWGYHVLVPTTRPLVFDDTQYHRRNVDLVKQTVNLALDGELDLAADPERVAVGGHSIGATMALFAAAEEQAIDTAVVWAPTGAPFWQGLDPDVLYPLVTQPTFYLLAEYDIFAPPSFYPMFLQEVTPSVDTELIIQRGRHVYFQQPTGGDTIPELPIVITRLEQQQISIDETRAYLDDQFGLADER